MPLLPPPASPAAGAVLAARHDSAALPAVLTPWTVMHVASGGLAYAALAAALPRAPGAARLGLWFALHAAYEAKDFYFTYVAAPAPGQPSNSWPNSLGDQAAGMLGYALAARLRARPLGAALAMAAAVLLLSSPLFAEHRHQDAARARSGWSAPTSLWTSRG